MKILFICGTAEPGRDGVGDYVRRIAGSLIIQGYPAAILALQDKYVSISRTELQTAEGAEIQVLRVPYSLPESLKYSLARDWIEEYRPSCLSLQFVPFTFHPKGLVFGLGKKLKTLAEGYRWHVMIHELWVGMAKEEPFKLKLWGALQRFLIKDLLKSIKPVAIHTQTHLYKKQLQKLGFTAHYLPLVSNIPVKETLVLESDKISEGITLVLFGVIHKKAPVKQLAKEAALYSQQNDKEIHLILVGRNGSEQEEWKNAWTDAGLSIEILGEQPIEIVSKILNNSSAGLSTTAYAVVEKSGSFAALSAHGLPVLCVSPPWTPTGVKNLPSPKGIFNYRPGTLGEFLQQKKKINDISVNKLAKEFIESLKAFQ